MSTGMSDARRSARTPCAAARAAGASDIAAAALRVGVSDAGRRARTCARSRRSAASLRRAGRPVGSRRAAWRGGRGRGARRLALRAPSGPDRTTTTRSTAPCRARRPSLRRPIARMRADAAGARRRPQGLPAGGSGEPAWPAAAGSTRRARCAPGTASDAGRRRRAAAGRRRCRRRHSPRCSARRSTRDVAGRRRRSPPTDLAQAGEARHEVASTCSSPPARGACRWCRRFSARCARRRCPARVIVTDVNPLSPAVHVADRAYRVPLVRRVRTTSTRSLAICEAERRPARRADDRRRAAGVSARRASRSRDARHRAWRVSPEPTTAALQRQVRDLRRTCARAAWRPPDVPAGRAAGRPGVAALHQAARRARRRRRVSRPDRRASSTSSSTTWPTPIVQEYLDGPEFTIDVLCDFDGRPLSIVPRERVVIRAGVIDRGRTVNDPRADRAGEAVCRGAAVCRRRSTSSAACVDGGR